MENLEQNVKKIVISLDPVLKKKEEEKTVKTEKERQKRQITTTNQWNFDKTDLGSPHQWNIIQQIHENSFENQIHCEFVINQIRRKISGYKAQDIDKSLLNLDKLVNVDTVIELLHQCENKCYYCKESVQILYEMVREPKQWTLDRLDNAYGHNNDNVVIACLSCNLRRKTMYHERFVFTKQLTITKIS